MSDGTDTRTRILDAALRLFFERGYDGTTTRVIAQRAGVNEVTLFRHSGNKQGIIKAVVDRETDITDELAEVKFEPTGDMEADLTILGEQMIHNMREKAQLVKIIMMETSRNPDIWDHVSSAPFQVLGRISQYFEEAQLKGTIRSVDPELAALAFFSFFFRSMISTAFLGSDIFIEMDQRAIAQFTNIIVNGLRVEG
jgi:AcrR family transcriptional regulator